MRRSFLMLVCLLITLLVFVSWQSWGPGIRAQDKDKADPTELQKKEARPAEPTAQDRGKLKALLTEQRELAKGQFAAWKSRAIGDLTARKLAREQAAGPFSGGSRAEAALEEERRLQLDPLRASDLQLQLYQWAQRLHTAELALADKKADRVAVHEAHVLRMKELEEAFKKDVEKGQPNVYAAEAAFRRLQAQIMLEREKAR